MRVRAVIYNVVTCYSNTNETKILEKNMVQNQMKRKTMSTSRVDIVSVVGGRAAGGRKIFSKILIKVCLKFTLYPTGRTYRIIWKFLPLSFYDFLLRNRRVFQKKKVSRTKTNCLYIFFIFACPSYSFLSFLSPFCFSREKEEKKGLYRGRNGENASKQKRDRKP